MSELNLYPKKGIYKKSVKIMLNVSDKKYVLKKTSMLKIFVFDQLNVVWTSQFGIAIFQYFWLKVSKYCETPSIPENIFCDCVCVCLYFVSIVYWQNITNYTKTLYRWKKQQLYKNICFMSNNEEILKYIDFSKSNPLN